MMRFIEWLIRCLVNLLIRQETCIKDDTPCVRAEKECTNNFIAILIFPRKDRKGKSAKFAEKAKES